MKPNRRVRRHRRMNTNTLANAFLSASILVAVSAGTGLAVDSSGSAPAGAEPSPVYVDSAELLYLESWPVQVKLHVEGSLPTPCQEAIFEVADLGDTIDVRLWSLADPKALCIAVLEPFEIAIDLGAYTSADLPVLLNGEAVGRIQVGSDPTGPALTGAGWSFGMCLGYCAADVRLDGDDVVVAGRDRDAADPLYENRGTLTEQGRERLDAALAGLVAGELEAVYGCPDCADGGAAYLELALDSTVERVEMEFGNPPPVLAELYATAMELVDAIETCETTPLVDIAESCVPYQR